MPVLIVKNLIYSFQKSTNFLLVSMKLLHYFQDTLYTQGFIVKKPGLYKKIFDSNLESPTKL